MILSELLEQQNMTKYRLSQKSGVLYTTLNDICNGKASLLKCSTETVYRIAKALNVSMELLISPYFEISFNRKEWYVEWKQEEIYF